MKPNQLKMLRQITKEMAKSDLRSMESAAFTNATVVMFWLLHDKYGFGKKRLGQFAEEIYNFCNGYVAEGYLSVEDMAQTLDEECGIHFELTSGAFEVR